MTRLILTALCLCLVGCWFDEDVPEEARQHVLVVGDSLSARSWPRYAGYVLEERGEAVTVQIEATGGWTWRHHLDNLAAITAEDADRIVVLLGTNDLYPTSPDRVTLDEALANADELLTILLAAHPRACVALMTLPGPAEGSTEEWASLHEAYNDALLERESARVDVLPAHLVTSPALYVDPVHLVDPEGYQALSGLVGGWLVGGGCR